MSKKRRKMKDTAYQDSYEERNSFSSNRVLDFSEQGEVKFYTPEKGENAINIIPYEIGKNHVLVRKGRYEPDDLFYYFDFWVHRGAGVDDSDIVCLKNQFGKACPICEERDRNRDDKSVWGQLRPQHKVAYNVIDADNPNEGLQVFITSFHLFQKEMIERANRCAKGDKIYPFADIEVGKVVCFWAQEEKFSGNKYLKFKDFSFEKRDEPLKEELIDKAIKLDSALIFYDYDKVVEMFTGGVVGDEKEETDEPVRKRRRSRTEVDDEQKEEEREEEEEVSPRRRRRREKESDVSENEGRCPFKHEYGKDFDEYKDCNKCDAWEDCEKEGE